MACRPVVKLLFGEKRTRPPPNQYVGFQLFVGGKADNVGSDYLGVVGLHAGEVLVRIFIEFGVAIEREGEIQRAVVAELIASVGDSAH